MSSSGAGKRDVDEGSTEGSPDTPADARAPWRRLRVGIAAGAAVVFVAALSGFGCESWILLQHHQKEASARQALAAARDYAVTLTTSEPDVADQVVNEIIDGATGEFRDKYVKVSSRMRKLMLDNNVVTHGVIEDSAIKSATAKEVEVLVVIRQSVTNSVVKEPQSEITPIAITMEKVGNRWLASKVTVLGG